MATSKAETPKLAFKRLAEARVSKAITAIQSVGRLANPINYEYTDAQVSKIVSALNGVVAGVKSSFANPGAKAENGFKL